MKKIILFVSLACAAVAQVTIDLRDVDWPSQSANQLFRRNTANTGFEFFTASPQLTLSGDATGSATFTNLTNATLALTLANSGVTAGSYGSATQSLVFTVDAKGRVTSASAQTVTPAFSSITGKPTTLGGYDITDAEPFITAGTTSQYRRGDKTWQTLDKAAVGLGSADNTSDANKPVSTAQAAADTAVAAAAANANNITSGTLNAARLPSTLTGINSITASVSTDLALNGGSTSGNVVAATYGGSSYLRVTNSTLTNGTVLSATRNSHSLLFDTGATTTIYTLGADTLALATNGGANGLTIDGTTQQVKVISTTASTSTTTGALQVAGGVGVAGAGYFGDTINIRASTAQGGIDVGATTANQASLYLRSTNAANVDWRIFHNATDGLGIEQNGQSALTFDSSTRAAKFAANISPSASSATWSAGSGSPEGVVTAVVGSLYSRTDGGAGTSLYVKESGSGNTGWVGK